MQIETFGIIFWEKKNNVSDFVVWSVTPLPGFTTALLRGVLERVGNHSTGNMRCAYRRIYSSPLGSVYTKPCPRNSSTRAEKAYVRLYY